MKFRVGQLSISISFFFPAIIGLFALTDQFGMLQTVLSAVVAHELSHIIALYLLDYPIERLSFDATGIAIQHAHGFLQWKHGVFIHLAGPFINLVLGLAALRYNHPMVAAINLTMGGFNLLPIGNLDGGNALQIFLQTRRWYTAKMFYWVNMLSVGALFLMGLYLFWENKQNFTLLLVAATMLRTIQME